MSLKTTATKLARRCLDETVAYVREFLLIAAYAAVCVAVCAPTLVATGGAIYWLDGVVGLDGLARTAYFGGGVVVLMFEFTVLHRFVQRVGRAMFGPTRDRVV